MDKPITLTPGMIRQCRLGLRTHVTMAATWKPGARQAFGEEAKSKLALVPRKPTTWVSLRPEDRLWVREDMAVLIDKRNPLGSRSHMAMELQTGKIPIPGTSAGYRYERYTKAARDMERCDSRFTMHVVKVSRFNAHNVTWEDMRAEGIPVDPYQTKGQWWQKAYGLFLPWEEDPDCIGISFTWQNGNIDTGREWKPEPFDRVPLPLARSIQGTKAVDD